ncbi:MAG: WD40 repeat domain-containing protein [Gemmataceae bacterium]|nr:WD40 repeat domain-containing protein [Gemmataceae bacterium]
MRWCSLGMLLCGFSLLATLSWAGQDEKDLARAEALIQELYKDDLAKAEKDPLIRTRLALLFLQEAMDTSDDPAGRSVLLRRSLELASGAGDVATAFQAIEEMALESKYTPARIYQMKSEALTTASTSVTTNDAYQTVYDSALALLEDALAVDDFKAAKQLVQTADNAGRKLRNVNLVSAVRKRADDIAKLEKEFARWAPFAEVLAKNPNDPEACYQMGQYQALMKGNWETGLPLLARGLNLDMKSLASADLAEPKTAQEQIKLAARWFKLGLDLKGNMQIHALLRAYSWYQQALADAGMDQLADIENQMKSITERLPAEYRIGEITAEVKKCDGHFGPVYDGAFAPDGKKFVTAAGDGSLRLWDARTGKELKRLEGHSGRVWTVAFAPDGRRVVSGGFDSTVRLWDLTSGRESRRFTGHNDYVRSVAISKDGRRILSGGDDRMVRLWNVDTGMEIRSFAGHGHFVWCVALSRDGKHALSASLDKTARLWDVETGQALKKLEGHKDTVLAVAFAPDGRRAVTGSTDHTLRVWDLASGECLKTLTGHKGYVHSVAFSPDGRRVLSAGADHTVRLWDVLSGKELRTLEGHRDQVWSVTFSRDGRLALSTGQDHTARVWGGAQ